MTNKEVQTELRKIAERYAKMSTDELTQRKRELEETPQIKYNIRNDIFGCYYQYSLLKRELELRDNDIESLKLLAEHSPVAKKILEQGGYRVIPLLTYNKDYLDTDTKDEQQFAFHPDGHCGCIELDDSNLGSLHILQCNHFMWCDGWIERYEPFFTKYDLIGDDDPINGDDLECVLCYGNHKGDFRMFLITHQI